MSSPTPRSASALRFLFALVAVAVWALPAVALGQEEGETPELSEEEIQLLIDGEQVYSVNCAGCHQPGGIGLEGQYPPLVGNPNVQDAAYVEQVIRNGLQGEIVVNGVTYDGVMPAFSTLSDEQITAVIAYIQAGFVIPGGGGGVDEGDALPVAGTSLPNFALMASTAAFGIAAVGFGIVLAPRAISVHDRRTMPWLDAWLKTAIIVVGLVVSLVILPTMVLEWEPVTRLPRIVGDLLATGLFTGALVVGIVALWWFHRENRI